MVPGILALALLWCAGATHLPGLAAVPDEPALVTLSIVGTSDLHGAAFPRNGLGGLPLLAGCSSTTGSAVPAQYEGKPVTNDPAVVEAMAATLRRVRALQATTLGVSLDGPIHRVGNLGSPLGNLFTEALRVAVPGADVAAINNAARGLWADPQLVKCAL